MVKKKRLILFLIVVCFLLFLTGCPSDDKHSKKINNKIKETAELEKDFVENQEELNKVREKAQQVYNDLINLDIKNTDVIHQKIKEANTYTKKQLDLIEKAEDNFQKAYKEHALIEKSINKIKNKEQRKQASKLLSIMEQRKNSIEVFFEDYRTKLDIQNTFYRQLDEDRPRVENLSEQIFHINECNKGIEEAIQRFNKHTEQYNQAKNEYFQVT